MSAVIYKYFDLISEDSPLRRYLCDKLCCDTSVVIKREIDDMVPSALVDIGIFLDSSPVALIKVVPEESSQGEFEGMIAEAYRYSNFFCSRKLEGRTVILVSSEFLKKGGVDVATYPIPHGAIMIEVSEDGDVGDFSCDPELIQLSDFFHKDSRLYELLFLLKYLKRESAASPGKINRRTVYDRLRGTRAVNAGNWQNAFITAKALGLIDSNNRLSDFGASFCALEYEEFVCKIYTDFYFPIINEIVKTFDSQPALLKSPLGSITSAIRDRHSGKDVEYLTQSDNRYLSSWLNVMRDDLGCMKFQARKHDRELIYQPHLLNSDELKNMILEKSKGVAAFAALAEELPNYGHE